MGKLVDPVHVFEDEDHEEKLELKQKETELKRRIAEKKMSVFLCETASAENDWVEGKALVEPEDVMKLARKLSEKEGYTVTPDEVVERYMNDEDETVTLESFFPDDIHKLVDENIDDKRALEDKKILEVLRKERKQQYKWLDEMLATATETEEMETLIGIKEVLRNATKT